MGKRKGGQSSNQIDWASFSFEKLAKAIAALLQTFGIQLKEIELKVGRSSFMSSSIQPVSKKKSSPELRREVRWELLHSISTAKNPIEMRSLRVWKMAWADWPRKSSSLETFSLEAAKRFPWEFLTTIPIPIFL